MKRMRLLARLLPALLIGLFLLGGCAGGPSRYERSFFDVFDTVTTVVLYAPNEGAAAAYFEQAHALLKHYHALFDIYNNYEGLNNARTVNERAGQEPVPVDDALCDLLLLAKQMHAQTGGKLNIALGSVLSIWHDYREAGLEDPARAELPPMEALLAAAAHTDIDRLIVDREAGTVFLEDPGMRIDLGGIAKGYAAQRVADEMRAGGISSMLLSVGGNICTVGARADGKGWRVSVQSPLGAGTIATLSIADESLVTSGSYQRFYTVNGVAYHHIIDPETLWPASYFTSVTVLAKDSALADALTTALFNLDLSEGRALVARCGGAEALWVATDGTQTMTEGFSAALRR